MFTVDQIKSLNELELSVYHYVMQHQSAIPYMRIRELAAEAHVSTTTVLRFCKKIGCDGYAEFKLRMKQELGQKNTAPVPDDLEELRSARMTSCWLTRPCTAGSTSWTFTAAATTVLMPKKRGNVRATPPSWSRRTRRSWQAAV